MAGQMNRSESERFSVDAMLVRAHGLAAMLTLVLAVVFGIVVSLQFFWPDLASGVPALGWGRLRYAHTQGIMLGWLGNAFFAFLYHAVPVMTGQPVTSQRLGFWLFGIWNFAVMLPGWLLVLSGVSQPLEWAEFPLVVDAFILVALLLAACQFLPAFFRRGLESLYVSSWYILGGLVFTCLAFPMGNLVPEFVPGAAGAAFSGLWIHDAVGLFVTPLALAILYFVIPAVTGRPVFSHFLSMLGFWGLFFLYPLNGTHHYVYSVIPMAAQFSAIAASALLGVVVVIVVTNLLMSLRGSGWLPKDLGLRFIATSTVFYLLVSLQGSLQAQMQINQAVHFTDWVIGHSHLAMLGFATFAAIGGLVHIWQRLPGDRFNPRAIEWSYWLLVVGITVMVVDLTIAGLVQAELWKASTPWLESVSASRPYWIVRSLAAVPITAGFLCLFVGLTTRPRVIGQPAADPGIRSPEYSLAAAQPTNDRGSVVTAARSAAGSGGGLMTAYVVASVGGIVCFVLSVSLLGVWPERVLSRQTALLAPEGLSSLSAAESRGRAIYAREGCAYCHTQQIRYIAADINRFGAPTLAWETRFDYPHLWGTRRIGPDLSRAAGTRSADWHFAHLYAPRSVVPTSIMPAYSWLFDGAADRPAQEARDLVAYLESLGRSRELGWPEGDVAARARVAGDPWAEMALTASVLNAHPARTRTGGDVPLLPAVGDGETGRTLWANHCAGCHGAEGRGDGPAAAALSPRPTDLGRRRYNRNRLAEVLWHGVPGTAMPAWRDYSAADRAALADVVQGFSPPAETDTQSAAQREQGRRVFLLHCAECHGDAGQGDGFAARDLPIAPSDFSRQQPALEVALNALRQGIGGTPMVPWTTRLNEAEILAVAGYVRSLFEPEPADD